MNPEEHPSFAEIAQMVILHNYVCVLHPGIFAQETIAWGSGESTWRAMVSACGERLAGMIAESLNNGSRMSEWLPVSMGDFTLMRATIENEDGQTLATFYK